MRMIVIGADTHKDTHTAVAVADGTGRLVDELTAPARKAGFARHLDWARALDPERVWAVEDCWHVSGGLERFLVASGERVVRVPPKLMGKSRKGSRERGKSDPIDAANVARAALREGVENLPAAYLDEEAMEIKLLLDHRESLVRARTDDQRRLRWHLHQLFPELEIPAGALDRMVWLDRIAEKLSRAPSRRACARRPRAAALDPLSGAQSRRARARDRDPGQGKGPGALGPARLRVAERGQDPRRDGRGRALRLRCEAGSPCRHCSHPCLLGAPRSPPPRPWRQSPAQLRPASHRCHTGPSASPRTRLSRSKASGGEVKDGSPALPQAPPGASGLAAFASI